MSNKLFLLFSLIVYLLPVSTLFPQKVKITKIIDTNLFEINKQDTVKLANLEIPSKATKDSLLKTNFIPYVLKYEYKQLNRKYFIMEYADSSDSLQRVRAVYLYEKHPLSKDLVNDDFLLKGYAKYIPVKDSDAQKECKKAVLKAQKTKKGIWNSGQYFHKDLGMRELSFHFGYGELGNNDQYTKYMISFQNEQNRTFSAKLQIAYYRHEILDYPEYYLDGEYYPPVEKVANDLFLNFEINGNSEYFGLKFLLRLYYTNLESGSGLNFIPFLPGIGINIGKIKTAYASFTLLPVSLYRLYVMSLSAHYFLPMPFWSIHFYYYFNPRPFDDNAKEFRIKLGFNLDNKFSFNLDVSSILPIEQGLSKQYYFLDFGVGYLFR